jgi:hypothetical protein
MYICSHASNAYIALTQVEGGGATSMPKLSLEVAKGWLEIS